MTESGAPPFDAKKCIAVLAFMQFVTPFSVQAYAPTLPLLIGVGLHQPELIGQLFSYFTIACILSFVVMGAALQRFSPRNLVLAALLMRAIAGILHSAGAVSLSSSTFPLVAIGRVLHGSTLATLSVTNSWVGMRIPVADRMTVISITGAALMCGLTMGPAVAGPIASLCPTVEMAYASPGLITTCSSLIALVGVCLYFDDIEALPSMHSRKAADEPPIPACKVWLLMATVFGTNLGGLSTESFTSLLLERWYNWEADDPRIATFWVPMGVTAMVGNIAFIKVMQKVNPSPLLLGSAALGLLFGTSMVPWSDLYSTVSSTWMTIAFTTWFLTGSFASTLAQATLSVTLPPSKQITFSFLNMCLAQVGRALGPILASTLFSRVDAWEASRRSEPMGVVAANAAMSLFLFLSVPLSLILPSCFYHLLFGPFLPIFKVVAMPSTVRVM